MLEIINLTKKFGSFTAVDKLNLQLPVPGLYIFVGTNGSGKSTLFNLIAGLIQADEGQILLDTCSNADQYRLKLGISPEPFVTEPSLQVGEILQMAGHIRKVRDEDIRYWSHYWELDAIMGKNFKSLSTGMRKRLSLALSLLGDPSFILWDEPFNGLDPLGIDQLNKLTDELIGAGKYVLLSTHLLNEIDFPGAAYIVMKDGKMPGIIYPSAETGDARHAVMELLKTN